MKKIIPSFIKNFIKKQLRLPKYNFQNISLNVTLKDYHSGDFDHYQNKFCLRDAHLHFDNNRTRFRNYMNYKFAEFAVMNNTNNTNNFLSAGVSYGTSLKIITHLLDKKIQENNLDMIKFFIIDNYKDVGNKNYNTDINNVKKDLKDIKNFKFKYIEDLLNESSFKQVEDGLIFTHLNTGNFEVEYNFLKKILEKTKKNGVIIIDNYGSYALKEQKFFDALVILNRNVLKIVLPSLQCVLIKF